MEVVHQEIFVWIYNSISSSNSSYQYSCSCVFWVEPDMLTVSSLCFFAIVIFKFVACILENFHQVPVCIKP
jgi:hypothetical protein